ncbi:MAG: sulfite exporter TauE/SafE family protein [Gemmatimonadota bacterium]
MRTWIFVALAGVAAVYLTSWTRAVRRSSSAVASDPGWPSALESVIGFVTNFFDTLGIGSFAPTTSWYKLQKVVPDERIPGTLNVGHTPPVIAQAFIFIAIIEVDPLTLTSMILASVVGAWFGAGVVAGLPRRHVQIGMGIALLVAAFLFLAANLGYAPVGGEAVGLRGGGLIVALGANLVLGALMTLGIGMYAPSMIVVSLLGMNPVVAFPIMMGSCAFLMPAAAVRFIRAGAYSLRPSLGLALGGVPAVLIAAFIVRSLPLATLRWLVVAVVTYAAVTMLRSAYLERGRATRAPVPSATS